MPSARLVFNDDATVLGPVLERTGEMIKAATSDIPRLRLGQEAMALDNRRFAHRQSMDLANLKMRQDAFQAEQDNALMENLFGPGAAGGTRSRAATGAGGTSTADGRLALAEDKQYETEYSSRAKRIQQALDAERAALPKHSGLTQDPTTLKWSEIPLTPEEVKQREKTARHNVGKRFITETDMDPITARVLHDMGFSINVPTQPGRQGAPVDGSLLSLSGGPAASALDLQRKRAAFVRLKGDPALQQRMGIDAYRLNELYQQLWPEAQGAPEAAPAAGVELPPLTIQAEGALEAPVAAPPAAPAQAPAAPASFRTPDELRIAEHHRASEVDAAIKALVAKAAADPEANLDLIRFLVNEQDPSGGMQRTPDLRDLLSLGQLSNLFTTGSMHPGLPEWLSGPKPMPRLPPRAATQTPQQRIAEVVDPLQGNANFTNRLSIGQR